VEPSADPERRRRRGKLIAFALFVITAAPFIAATLAYLYWPPASRLNYGTLIEPRPLPEAPLKRLDGTAFRLGELKGKWVLLQISSADCRGACQKALLHMRQVRLTQGKDRDRIERMWLITDALPVETLLIRSYDGMHFVRTADGSLLREFGRPDEVSEHVFLIDPLGNLMLRFPREADPSLMKKDLSRLLRLSRNG